MRQFFEDKNGNLSSARLGSLLLVFCFMGDWILHIVRNIEFTPDWSTVGLVAAGLGIKMMQKKNE